LSGTVVIAESLGFETLLHVRVDAKPVVSADVLDSIPEPGNALSGLAETDETTFVARLPAGTRVDEGQRLRLAVDLPQVKFFDLASGRALQ
jgi:hypothetical protein